MGRYKIPLDAYDMKPEGMIAYLRYNGWHFNKKDVRLGYYLNAQDKRNNW